jgi:hypothetical protein
MISVLTPYWRAVATIDDRVPPADREMYQIHMPRPASESAALWIVWAGAFLADAATGSAVIPSPISRSATSTAIERPRGSVMRPATNATVP